MKRIKTGVIGALASLLLTSVAWADDFGKSEYMNSCAACHGEDGAGGGPLAELMTVPVPSLTGLAAANDGAFPMLEVVQIIDGRSGSRGHGYPMPVWGDRFKADMDEDAGFGPEALVRGRILSLAYYLESIQQ